MKDITLQDQDIREHHVEEETRQFLTFIIGNETFGVEVGHIREVINYENVFKIPVVPDYIRGVINLRGEVVPIIDISYRFYKKQNEITKFTSIVITEIIVHGEMILLGFVIDAIDAVIDISLEKIEQTPDFGSKIRSDFIQGIGKTDGRFIVLLNVNKVLNIEELSDFTKFK